MLSQVTKYGEIKTSCDNLTKGHKQTMPPRAKKRQPFAERLVLIRKSKGLSQYELAARAGISQRMVAHYETVVTNPASNTVLLLAKALDVSVDELVNQKGEKAPPPISRRAFKSAKMLDRLPPSEQKKVSLYIKDLAAKLGKK
jgi:transcriptional regulator with XRE-family HTH domain